jgi:GT2 family glycosyltransferase
MSPLLPHSPSPAFSPPPRLSVVVPLYNCLPLTQAMLASLQATLPAGLTHEIILIDDGSTDGTREWLLQHPPLRAPPFRVLLNERNLGFAAGNNRAVAIAQGEFLALLNNDLVLLPGWLEPMLAAHQSLANRAGLIGNVQLDARTGAVDHAGLEITPAAKPVHTRTLPRWPSRRLRPVAVVPAVTGACVLLTRTLWQELGGFDEGFVNGGEDIDLCYRARAAGRRNAVALRSVVRHHVSSSPGRKARDEENSYRLAQRWRRELIFDATPAWCRAFLGQMPHSSNYLIVLAALAFLAGLRRTPPRSAIAGVESELAREFARWDQILPPSSGFRPAKS